MKRLLLPFLLLATPVAAQDGPAPALANEQLSDPAQEAMASALMQSLRCVQCQGQSIADSDAPIAGAMRAEVRRRISAGEKPEAIRAWMVDRYGQWVSFEPPASGAGLFLWLLPLLLVVGGAWFARSMFKAPKQ